MGLVEAGRRDSNSRAGAWHDGCDEAMATSRMTTSRTESRMASSDDEQDGDVQ